MKINPSRDYTCLASARDVAKPAEALAALTAYLAEVLNHQVDDLIALEEMIRAGGALALFVVNEAATFITISDIITGEAFDTINELGQKHFGAWLTMAR